SKPTANTWSESNSASLHQTQGASSLQIRSALLNVSPFYGVAGDQGLSVELLEDATHMVGVLVDRDSRGWWEHWIGFRDSCAGGLFVGHTIHQ
ncbi:hypothetical protein, partial [Kocuria sp. CPCC 204721]|uniref:hypothetical protein n=1 Tax=Kocuria sp. CPCC 204721 TaxID=3073548 RepID=UPI0034D405E0